mgnify:CR=1 FL=1
MPHQNHKNMKKLLTIAIAMMAAAGAMAQSKVYFTKEITPESLVKVYKALGVEPISCSVVIKRSNSGKNCLVIPSS